MTQVHIYAPETHLRRRIIRCGYCECQTECVAAYAVWHDTIITCTRCGDSWSGGYLHERPFARGWRKEAVRRALRDYAEATHGEPPRLIFDEIGPRFARAGEVP